MSDDELEIHEDGKVKTLGVYYDMSRSTIMQMAKMLRSDTEPEYLVKELRDLIDEYLYVIYEEEA